MGFCRDKVKPAVRRIRSELKEAVLAEAATILAVTMPLVADGRLSKSDAQTVGAELVKTRHRISTTAATVAMNLAHEMLTHAGATVAEMQAAGAAPDAAGANEIDVALG